MSTRARRWTVEGTAKVVHFNWPKYIAVAALALVALLTRNLALPFVLRIGLQLAATLGVAWSITSLIATWWVYDHRRIYERVPDGLGPLGTWATVHAGFDDATAVVSRSSGTAPSAIVKVRSSDGRSLRRATRSRGTGPGRQRETSSLDLESSSLDALLMTFSAHEIRDGDQQEALFAEMRRVLRPGGRLVMTEHLLDLANLAVFGPGAFHFQPAATWVGVAAGANLELESDERITPFVHRLVWRR